MSYTGLSQPLAAYAPPELPGGIIDASRGGEIPSQSVYSYSTTKNFKLGTQFITPMGKKFQYCQNGAVAIAAPGYMQQGGPITAVTTLGSQAPGVKFTGITQNNVIDYGSAVVGATEIVMLCTTASAVYDNLFADGTLVVKDGTGVGDVYTVLASKLDPGIDTHIHLLLASPIRTAFDATTVLTLITNKCAYTVIAPASMAASADAVGVCVCPAVGGVAVPASTATVSYYYWAQIAGDAPAIADANCTLVVGCWCGSAGTSAAAGTFGQTPVATYTNTPIYGIVRQVGAAGKAAIVDLKLG